MDLSADPSIKYKPYTPLQLTDRQWPSKVSTKPPIWLSTDLRDGNQALANPMTIPQKTTFFRTLLKCGLKEIEIAYPAASDTDFAFVRGLIENGEVPDDVWLQVLTPAREDLIKRTIESLAGAKRAILHMYNATCPCFREVVFGNTQEKTIELAIKHTRIVRKLTEEATAKYGTVFKYEYSPETFSQTEPDFAIRVCEAVKEAWGKASTGDERIIFNLPATVEIGPPNHYADLIENFHRKITEREKIVISLHPHNDRGTGIAAAELGVLAGADRIEGCLFGNGERTGNVDLVNLALNLYTQGIHPGVDFSDIQSIIDIVTQLALRSFKISSEPAADLAESGDEAPDERRRFDGTISVDGVLRVIRGDGNGPLSALLSALRSHLDIDLAIREYSEHAVDGTAASYTQAASYVELVPSGPDVKESRQSSESWWGVGIDSDIASSGLRAVLSAVNNAIGTKALPELKLNVGFNTTSGQADIADAIVNALQLELPRRMQASFFEVVQRAAQSSSGQISYDALTDLFRQTYDFEVAKPSRISMNTYKMDHLDGNRRQLNAEIAFEQDVRKVTGEGNGALSAVLAALHSQIEGTLKIREYSEHSLGRGTEVQAASYVELSYDVAGRGKAAAWGVSTDTDITASGLKAVLRAASRLDVVMKK
ncbi:hypothetical protein HWV62_24778 [Athelia sp. TMB]|nr:hypothetical protein HWV62_24778 [Athelia sp. TMB]